jgi:flagella basal body P-ring formation protein FlgA
MSPESKEFVTFASGIVVAALLACMATAARSAEPVTLRDDLSVTGDVVTISDLFNGTQSDAVLTRAPSPGRTVTLDPQWVAARLAEQSISWPEAASKTRLQVTREADSVSREEIAALIEDELEAQNGARWQVELPANAVLHAPKGAPRDLEILSLQSELRGPRINVALRYGPGLEPVRYNATAREVIEVPVLATGVQAGEMITADHLEWQEMPALRVNADMIADPVALIGKEARRALRARQPVRALDVRAPFAIKKGETVMLVYQMGALKLTTRGRALNNAAEGETLRMLNTQSNRTVEAVALRAGLARVENTNSLTLGES